MNTRLGIGMGTVEDFNTYLYINKIMPSKFWEMVWDNENSITQKIQRSKSDNDYQRIVEECV